MGILNLMENNNLLAYHLNFYTKLITQQIKNYVFLAMVAPFTIGIFYIGSNLVNYIQLVKTSPEMYYVIDYTTFDENLNYIPYSIRKDINYKTEVKLRQEINDIDGIGTSKPLFGNDGEGIICLIIWTLLIVICLLSFLRAFGLDRGVAGFYTFHNGYTDQLRGPINIYTIIIYVILLVFFKFTMTIPVNSQYVKVYYAHGSAQHSYAMCSLNPVTNAFFPEICGPDSNDINLWNTLKK